MIPSILESWYASRKQYQAKLIKAKDAAGAILDMYDSDLKSGIKRGGKMIAREDADEYDKHMEEAGYYDRLQYVYKIRLNGFYGALANQHFKFGGSSIG